MTTPSYDEIRSWDERVPFPASVTYETLLLSDTENDVYLFDQETQTRTNVRLEYPKVDDNELRYDILPSDKIIRLPEFNKSDTVLAVLLFHERFGTNVMPFLLDTETGVMTLSGTPWSFDFESHSAIAFKRSESGKSLLVFFHGQEDWEKKSIPTEWFS